jgi:Mg-chelatase subunit ChlD
MRQVNWQVESIVQGNSSIYSVQDAKRRYSNPKLPRDPRELEAGTKLKMAGGKMPMVEEKGKGKRKRKRKARRYGREEKREEIAQLSDAQITMQIPTDRRAEEREGRKKKREEEEEEQEESEEHDGALLFVTVDQSGLTALTVRAKDHKGMVNERETGNAIPF